jgi:hypothetical protein
MDHVLAWSHIIGRTVVDEHCRTARRHVKSGSLLPGTVRSHIHPSWTAGTDPPTTVAGVPLAVRGCSLFESFFVKVQ